MTNETEPPMMHMRCPRCSYPTESTLGDWFQYEPLPGEIWTDRCLSCGLVVEIELRAAALYEPDWTPVPIPRESDPIGYPIFPKLRRVGRRTA